MIARQYEREARRESFREVPETCQAIDAAAVAAIAAIADALPADLAVDVDGAIDTLIGVVKVAGTETLRAAYIQALAEKLAAEADRDEEARARRSAEQDVDQLEKRVADLERQVERLEEAS